MSIISISRSRLRSAVLATVLAVVPAALAAQGDRPATVRGRVVDAASGDPVAGVAVAMPELRKRAYTDRTGTFTLVDVPAGAQRLTVAQLGYKAQDRALQVPAGDSLTVRLESDPVLLQGITAQVDRLEFRRVHSTLASRTFDQRQIAGFGHPSPVDFLRNVANLRLSRCSDRDLYGGAAATGECVYSRGGQERVMLVIDERVQRGGIDMLSAVPLQEVYRIEVYEGGAVILVYTKQFMQAMLRGGRELHPLNAFRRMTEAAGGGSTVLTPPPPER